MLCVEFIKARSFVADGMEKDLIFPQFTRQRGQLKIQGLDVLDVFSMLKYLAKRFKYKGTTRIRSGEKVHDFKTGRRWKIEGKKEK
jgi:hypothetical protein